MAFSEGNQLFAGDLHVFLDEVNAMLQINGTVNGLSNIKDTIAESFQQQISVPHQSMCIFKTGLLSISDKWVKHKEKIPDVSDSNQPHKAACNPKLKFTELKDLFIQKVQKN